MSWPVSLLRPNILEIRSTEPARLHLSEGIWKCEKDQKASDGKPAAEPKNAGAPSAEPNPKLPPKASNSAWVSAAKETADNATDASLR